MGLWTGQHQGDLLRGTWSAYDGKALVLRQAKSRRQVFIPMGETLKAVLSEVPRTATTIPTNQDGQPGRRTAFEPPGASLVQRPVSATSTSMTYARLPLPGWLRLERRQPRLLPSRATPSTRLGGCSTSTRAALSCLTERIFCSRKREQMANRKCKRRCKPCVPLHPETPKYLERLMSDSGLEPTTR